MSLLSRLLGSKKQKETSRMLEEYKGFLVVPDPQREGKSWRLAARIEKDGKTHHLIRADTIADHDDAVIAAIAKAKQVINEQGDGLFT